MLSELAVYFLVLTHLARQTIPGAHSAIDGKVYASDVAGCITEQIHQSPGQIFRPSNSFHRRRFLKVVCDFWSDFSEVQIQVRFNVAAVCMLAE